MSGPTRPPSGGAPRQPWTPDQAPKGVTCPACGLANEAGARVCRNCGLPIASSEDPLRGVTPGHVDMPSAKRSGLSATVGLALVVGLLLIAGTLAVSGGGILNSGGRLGVEPGESEAPAASGDPVDGNGSIPAASGDPDIENTASTGATGTSFAFTCDDDAVKDLSRRKWNLSNFTVGNRASSGYDQVTWRMSRQGNSKVKRGTVVTMRWMDPGEARNETGAPSRVQGQRALVVTFDGPVGITVNQTVDTLTLEPEGVSQIRNIQMFDGKDGNVHTVVGLRSDSCARLEAKGWGKKSRTKNSALLLQIERE